VARGEARGSADIEDFRRLAQESYGFNQDLLCRLAPLWGLKISDRALPPVPPPAPRGPWTNHNFTIASPAGRLARRLLGLARRALGRRRTRPLLPALSMGYATQALQYAGFYEEWIVNIQRRARVGPAAPDPGLRRELGRAVARCRPAVEDFLRGAGVAADPAAAAEALAGFVADATPAAFLEAVPANIAACREVLAPLGSRPLLVGEAGTLEPTFMMAAARTLGLSVIGFQHGGHYGLMDDHTWALETEYSYYDRFVTWGWDQMPDWPTCRAVEAVALPNPWLSERRRYWRRALPRPDAGGASYDLLLMPNLLYRFPPAPSGGAVARGDCLAPYSRLLLAFVKEASAAGVRVLHKPYNRLTVDFLPRLHRRLAEEGGENYRRLDRTDKGLHPELLRQCRAVVWDQAGDGLLECLACDIPAWALWPRVYSRESQAARALVAGLEAAGIIHREPAAVISAYRSFRADPRAWGRDPARAEAVRRFLRAHAWVEEDWAARWKDFLAGL
jgi:hypothetical protein